MTHSEEMQPTGRSREWARVRATLYLLHSGIGEPWLTLGVVPTKDGKALRIIADGMIRRRPEAKTEIETAYRRATG